MNNFLFILAYYLVWLGSLILASYNFPWFALAFSLVISTLQLHYFNGLSSVPSWKKFFLCMTFIGFCVDSLFSFSSFIRFYFNPWQPFLAPPWILGLWINFSVLCIGLNVLLKQLHHYLWLIALLVFPAVYLGGVAYKVAIFPLGTPSSVVLGLVWMFLFPLVFRNTL